jgi:hypothetical protein
MASIIGNTGENPKKKWELMNEENANQKLKNDENLRKAIVNSLNDTNNVNIDRQRKKLEETSEFLRNNVKKRQEKNTYLHKIEQESIEIANKNIEIVNGDKRNNRLTLKEINTLIYEMQGNLLYSNYDYLLYATNNIIIGIQEKDIEKKIKEIISNEAMILRVVAIRGKEEKEFSRLNRENKIKNMIEGLYTSGSGEVKTKYEFRF